MLFSFAFTASRSWIFTERFALASSVKAVAQIYSHRSEAKLYLGAVKRDQWLNYCVSRTRVYTYNIRGQRGKRYVEDFS